MSARSDALFKVGTRVVVKRYPTAVRTIVAVYSGVFAGARLLDSRVAGSAYWNVDDLRRAPARKAKR